MNRIREYRMQRKMTQQSLAEIVGVSRPFVVDIELNRRGAKPETWQRFSDALGVPVDELRGDDHDKAVDH